VYPSSVGSIWIRFLTVETMAQIKVTQIRSTIGRPARQLRTMDALGLGKVNRTVVHNLSPQILGMVKQVSHLVKVEEA
jgi:large subunit ribosomal protein L30